MHIKSIHLDGFKSYQKHTDIVGFSPQFNAITGYNGSGKSNVLDSICFILGINKLDNIRAKSMAELITHGGSKATVQIRFDNRDKRNSPYGMEQFDEITVQRTITAQPTGKGCSTSYMLNGHAATNTRIQDFFRGIGLNVNNPHFLIMQGRITTVLNMKPEEILGMVEEAVGTKMFDQKKREAEKTMAAKRIKLNEIDRIFETTIDPLMAKFREDRKNMIEATRLGKRKENSQRKLDAFRYYQMNENATNCVTNRERVQQDITDQKAKMEQLEEDLKNKEAEKEAVERDRNDSSTEGKLLDDHREKQRIAMDIESERNKVLDSIAKIRSDEERREKTLAKDRRELERKGKELEDTEAANNNDIQSQKENEKEVEKLRNEIEAITRGTVANDKGEQVSLETVIQDTKSKAADLEASIRTANNRRERAEGRIAQLQRELDVERSQTQIDFSAIKRLEDEHADLLDQMKQMNFDFDADKKLREKRRELHEKYQEVETSIYDSMKDQIHGPCALQYNPPAFAGFDERTDIKGLLIHFMSLKPEYEKYGCAVNVVASPLYTDVVVRNQDIARALIENKAFRDRRTMIPWSENDRLPCAVISESKFAIAKEIADRFNEPIVKMIDLIHYPEELSNTFIRSFGRVLIVESVDCAKVIAFHEEIKTRCLSVRGEDILPNGVMTGGYIPDGSHAILKTFAPLREARERLKIHKAEFEVVDKKVKETDETASKYESLTTKSKEVEAKLASAKNRLSNSKFGMIEKDLEEQKQQYEAACKDIEENKENLKVFQEKVRDLESRRGNDKNSHDQLKKEIAARLVAAEQRTGAHKEKAEKARRAVLQLQATYDDLAQSIKKEEDELLQKRNQCSVHEAELPGWEAKLAAAKQEEQEACDKLSHRRENQKTLTAQHSKISKECDNLRKEQNKTKAKLAELESEIVRLDEAEKSNRKAAQQMLKKYEWLEEEQAHFNKKGGLYDFEGYSVKKGEEEIKQLTDTKTTLERNFCMKNVSNLDTHEARVTDVKNKRAKIQEDFDMLKKTIGVLDKKKVDELVRAHEAVNKNFGTIFNCLLPDASAKLVAPEGKTVCEGLEVKVSFNGVTKDSLQELSGGQRSLVALSLILAMLKFKPAPLYILDEVDAALDLSHTANIGMMIKSQFSNNQFIIVSLKQGMFSNADSLFQTTFTDGHSNCKMLTGNALERAKNDAKLAQQAKENESEQNSKKTKKSAKKNGPPVDDDDVDITNSMESLNL